MRSITELDHFNNIGGDLCICSFFLRFLSLFSVLCRLFPFFLSSRSGNLGLCCCRRPRRRSHCCCCCCRSRSRIRCWHVDHGPCHAAVPNERMRMTLQMTDPSDCSTSSHPSSVWSYAVVLCCCCCCCCCCVLLAAVWSPLFSCLLYTSDAADE